MKKLLAILLAVSVLLGLTACGQKKEETVEEAPKVTTYDIGVAVYQFDDAFMTLYRRELESYFKTKETDTVKYALRITDGENNAALQETQVRQMIQDKVDVIILNLVQTVGSEALLQEITDAKIPLVLINREPCSENGTPYSQLGDDTVSESLNFTYIGADGRQSGYYQGEILLAQPNHGDWNGDGVISYVMLEGDPQNIDSMYRTQLSVQALVDAGYQVDCLLDAVGDWDRSRGESLCAAALKQYGMNVEVVLCNNDAMALGAAAALSAAGRIVGTDVCLLGVDGLEECQKMVENGTMTGTVLNDHVGQAHAAADVALKLLCGEAVDRYYWVDYVKVMR